MSDPTATSAHPLEALINEAFERRAAITPANADPDLFRGLGQILHELNMGRLRAAEKRDGTWITNQWIKKAVLLYFRTHDNKVMHVPGRDGWFDKIPVRFQGYSDAQFRDGGFRVVPPATVRSGAFIGRNVVLMPSYVNIGAYVDEGTMVDTWATVGSCVQIGKNVHLSGGVGIGGVLEPLQANPTIIEDNCFIGARSEIVEGVIVEAGSVISMGVFIGQSTKIYDRSTGEILYGRVPSGSVVVPGSLPSADGRYSLACAVIVKRVDAETRAKTSINELLRFDAPEPAPSNRAAPRPGSGEGRG
jgi:2,3,4,5-tetrahydropyridine-2-carboxylate N-succinyltransferase